MLFTGRYRAIGLSFGKQAAIGAAAVFAVAAADVTTNTVEAMPMLYQLDFSGEINSVTNGPAFVGPVVGSIQFEKTADTSGSIDFGVYNMANVSGSIDVGSDSFSVGTYGAVVGDDIGGGTVDQFFNVFNASSGTIAGQPVINAVLDLRGLISTINNDSLEDAILNVNDFDVSQLLQIATDNVGGPDTLYRGSIEEISFTEIVEEPEQVPEPSTLALMGLGIVGAGFARSRKFKDGMRNDL